MSYRGVKSCLPPFPLGGSKQAVWEENQVGKKGRGREEGRREGKREEGKGRWYMGRGRERGWTAKGEGREARGNRRERGKGNDRE